MLHRLVFRCMTTVMFAMTWASFPAMLTWADSPSFPHHPISSSGHHTGGHDTLRPGPQMSGQPPHYKFTTYQGYELAGPHQNASQFIRHILRFKEGLGITEEQEQQLRALETDYRKTRIALQAQVDITNIELHNLLRDEQSNLSDIETQLKALYALKADLSLASIKTKRAAKAILTEKQRARMKAVHERIKAYREQMRRSPGGGFHHHRQYRDKEQD
ncbi:MAG: hypothetical protein D6704_01855 [Nitrospirae bacterium]|nr:MAG: hypothetical protein D6704_01855 [Nitrospirota bacterium]